MAINSTTTDDLAHHWVMGKPNRIVDITISRQPPKGGVAQRTNKVVHSVIARLRIPQLAPRQIMKAQGLVQLPELQQAAIGTDFGAVKFQ